MKQDLTLLAVNIAYTKKLVGEVKNELLETFTEVSLQELFKGEKGNDGERGRTGNPGRSGKQGSRGRVGEDGKDGQEGPAGTAGTDGKDGINGSHGTDGRDGKTPSDGKSGKDGKRGERGVPGRPGTNGKDGKVGSRGKDGKSGSNGKSGDRGKSGLAGKSGKNGDKGLRGESGKPGKDGKSGTDGKHGDPGLRGEPGTAATEVDTKKMQQSIQDELFRDLNKAKKDFTNKIARMEREVSSYAIMNVTSGGGSVNLLQNDDVEYVPLSNVANNAIFIFNQDEQKFNVISLIDVIESITGLLEVQFDKLIDEVGVLTYVGEADPGATTSESVWRIKRIDSTNDPDIDIRFANGSADFDKIWDNRASLTY